MDGEDVEGSGADTEVTGVGGGGGDAAPAAAAVKEIEEEVEEAPPAVDSELPQISLAYSTRMMDVVVSECVLFFFSLISVLFSHADSLRLAIDSYFLSPHCRANR